MTRTPFVPFVLAVLLAGLGLFAPLAGGCSSTTPFTGGDGSAESGVDGGSECGNVGDPCCFAARCLGANLCSAGRCVSPIQSDAGQCGASGQACCAGSGCNSGFMCRQGVCGTLNGTGTRCFSDTDCPSGDKCFSIGNGSSVCGTSCGSSADCVKGWNCLMGSGGFYCQCTAKPETCNLLDDDCNGVVDDQPAVNTACGGTCTNGVCSCSTGSMLCTNACKVVTNDTQNCGSCNNQCFASAGGSVSCITSKCRELVTIANSGGNSGLALDSSNIYWVTGSEVVSAPKIQNATTTVLSSTIPGPHAVAVSGGFVYVTTSTNLYRVTTSGSFQTPTQFTSAVVGTAGPIVTDGVNAYFTSSAKLYKVSLSATAPATPTVMTTLGGTATAITLDSSNVYVSDANNTVWVAPINGGGVQSFASAGQVVGMAIEGGNLFYALSTGIIEETPVPVSTTGSTFVTGLLSPTGLATDGTDLFFTSLSGGIRLIATTGDTTPVDLADSQSSPSSPIADSTYVYFQTTQGPRRVNAR
jgi:hypothetical protein